MAGKDAAELDDEADAEEADEDESSDADEVDGEVEEVEGPLPLSLPVSIEKGDPLIRQVL